MHIAEFTTSKFCTFNDFFHFLGLNWSLNDVKHTIVVFQKQLISTKHSLRNRRLKGAGGGGGGGSKKEKEEGEKKGEGIG